MGKGRVLIIDNRPDHIQPRREVLEEAGYEVWEAHTSEEARKKLETGLVHLAIVDIRLQPGDPPGDWSGLELVEEVHREHPDFPMLILTAFPSYEAVQRARRPDKNGLPPAEEFLYKGGGLEELIQAVKTAFAKKVRINPYLRTDFGGPFSLLCMADMIERASKKDTQENQSQGEQERQVQRSLKQSLELRDLFCKLFYEREQIVVYPLLPGRGGGVVVAVRPVSHGRPEPLVIAKIGNRGEIEKEASNYNKYAKRFVASWAPKKEGTDDERPTARTLHFAGLVYSVAAGGLDRTERFRDFYRANKPDEICQVLSSLFVEICKNWYQVVREDDAESLSVAYRRELELTDEHHSRKNFCDALSQLCSEAAALGLEIAPGNGKLLFGFRGGPRFSYPDPTRFVFDDIEDFGGTTLKCITHGDFNGDNLLIDQKHGGVWLIDFARTGEGPALRDFAELESVIRFDLLREDRLPQLHRFEEKLLACTALGGTPAPDEDMPEDLKKAMQVIVHLRKLANGVRGANLYDYFASLLFYTAWMILTEGSSPPTMGQARPANVRKTHALFLAAMICDWLERGGPRPAGVTATMELLRPTIATGVVHLPDAQTVARIQISNYSAEPASTVVSWQINRFSESAPQTIELGPYEKKTCDYRPHFAPMAIRGIGEKRMADLYVQAARLVEGREHIILRQPYKVYLLPRNVILWAISDAQGHVYDFSHHIGAWVTPEAEAIAELQRGILEKHPDRQMIGYQGRNIPEEREVVVREQIRAIYNYLKHVRNMAYADTSINFGRIGLAPGDAAVAQVVRLPHETVGVNRGTANCIDATVLFASLIERFSMNPAVVLVPGHAFLGWQTWPGSPRYEYLETTVIARADFDDAARSGNRQHEQAVQEGLFHRDLSDPQGYAREWSVWRLREQGVQAMPLEGE